MAGGASALLRIRRGGVAGIMRPLAGSAIVFPRPAETPPAARCRAHPRRIITWGEHPGVPRSSHRERASDPVSCYRSDQRDQRQHVKNAEDYLHVHRRSACAGDPLAAADHRRLHRCCRHRGGDPRHLPGGADPLSVPRLSGRRPAHRGPPGRTGRPDQDAGGQHHQAAQYQCLHAAAAGGDQGAAGPGLRPAGLPGRAAERRGA